MIVIDFCVLCIDDLCVVCICGCGVDELFIVWNWV